MKIKKIGNLEIRIFFNLEELSRHAAQIFASESKKIIELNNIFTVSLSGGSTPKRLFELLAADFKNVIDWQKVHVFWGDERERKDNPESNFQLAFKTWLEKIIKEEPSFKKNVHRIKIELGLTEGAKDYANQLNKWAPDGFDLAFNGAGPDGHRNGIMPENPNINWKNEIWELPESIKVWGYNIPPEINPCSERITITPWFLNNSKINTLMLSEEEKADLLRKIAIGKGKYTKRELPAITFTDVPTIVLADKTAASQLSF